MDTIFQCVLKQVIQFFGQIQLGKHQNLHLVNLQLKGQFILVPSPLILLSAMLSAFLFFVHLDDDTLDFCDTHIHENLQSLMPTDNMAGHLIQITGST